LRKTIKRTSRDSRRVRRALDLARVTNIKSTTLALAASQVVARRTALGLATLVDPAGAEHPELRRILPEKIKAFSNLTVALAQRSSDIGRQIVRYSGTEAAMLASAASALAKCRDPAAMVAVQTQFATGWYFRTLSHAIAINSLAMRAWSSVVAPMHQVVNDNARRLR
jgi:phasin protein